MTSRWNKKEIRTIPNALSVFRLALIPAYLWLYCRMAMYGWAVAVLAVSGLSDILDGWIARRFDMVSDVGKILDPAADKFTQAALIVSLTARYPVIWGLFALFAVKELLVACFGMAVMFRTDTVHGARWFGKLCTAVLEVGMGALILIQRLPDGVVTAVILLCGGMLVLSCVKYIALEIRLLREHNREKGV